MACNCANEEVSKKILEMMKESGAHLQGHFKLTSGLHSDNYMQCALMLRFPQYAAYAGAELANTRSRVSRSSYFRRLSAASSSGTKSRALSACPSFSLSA